ncbi:oligosaccharide flippase family protein [Paracoccus cavernae]|uniref:Oligosaccharide flippase family protein n=1 Tax=Paracoccus cavernae TaxID=1571207 RepID=A0ABT8DBA6_9RHOB|nr:oligosaccharide flippase family protein [Paracoccus cavernae]
MFYNAPQFAQVFPVAAISLLIAGFNPTRIDTAARHMFLGRLTAIELIAQAINIGIVVLAAYWLHSVWALVIGNIAGAAVMLLLTWLFLPGHINRFRLEPEARSELVHFGKWIFLSTICGFLLFQGDRLILGRVLSLEQLGIYNIGQFLGTVPMMLGGDRRAAVHPNVPPTSSLRRRQQYPHFGQGPRGCGLPVDLWRGDAGGPRARSGRRAVRCALHPCGRAAGDHRAAATAADPDQQL